MLKTPGKVGPVHECYEDVEYVSKFHAHGFVSVERVPQGAY